MMSNSMRNLPRWRNLKHFNHVTTIEYTDGQTFLDILKVQFEVCLCIRAMADS